MYSTTSELTKAVCKLVGFRFEIQFVKTMERKGKIYVKGTLGKPHEFLSLKKACSKHGLIYMGAK